MHKIQRITPISQDELRRLVPAAPLGPDDLSNLYKVTEITHHAGMMQRPPGGPGFTAEEVEDAVRMEVWGTKFEPDSVEEYCLFRLFDQAGNFLRSKKLAGY